MSSIQTEFLTQTAVMFTGISPSGDIMDLSNFCTNNPDVYNIKCVNVIPVIPKNNNIGILNISYNLESIPMNALFTSKFCRLFNLISCHHLDISSPSLSVMFEDIMNIGNIVLTCNSLMLPRDSINWEGTSIYLDLNISGIGDKSHTFDSKYSYINTDKFFKNVYINATFMNWTNGSIPIDIYGCSFVKDVEPLTINPSVPYTSSITLSNF